MEHILDKEFSVELLNVRFNIALFDSGDEDLNDYLKNDALREQDMLLSKTHLCFYRDKVAGFITLAADSIRLDKDKLNESQIIDSCDYPAYPSILIARLASDKRLHGRGVGSYLLGLAIGFALDGPLGCRFLAVDPKQPKESSRKDGKKPEDFYKEAGFDYWTKSKRRMYLNLEKLARQLRQGKSPDYWSIREEDEQQAQ